MKYNLLGKTGVYVSEICLGAMTFGGKGFWKVIGNSTQNEVNTIVKTSFDAGINFIDTANIYSEGMSETLLGEAVKDLGINRQKLVIASKVRGRMGDGVNQVGLSRLHISNSVDDSLKRLKMDYIDLLYIHGIDPITPLEETMRGLEDVVRSGKVRYLGISNHPAWMIMKANSIAEKSGWTKFVATQSYYSIAGREIEREIIPMAQSEGLSVMPWSPLAGGFLSGKYTKDNKSSNNSRRDNFDFPPVNKEKAYPIIDLLIDIGSKHNASAAQVALAWMLTKKGVTSIIIGAKRIEQLNDNIASTKLKLSSQELDQLDKISALSNEYPSWMVDIQSLDRYPTTK